MPGTDETQNAVSDHARVEHPPAMRLDPTAAAPREDLIPPFSSGVEPAPSVTESPSVTTAFAWREALTSTPDRKKKE